MKSNKFFWLLTLFISLMLVLAACSGDDNDTEPEQDDEEEETPIETDDEETEDENATESTEEDHIIIATNSDIVDLDPHGSNDVPSSNVRRNIYDTLVYQTPDLELVPGLATDWEQVSDTTIKFNLRDDVVFHDGS